MNKWEQKIEEAMKDCMPWKAEIIRCAKTYIEANHASRSNPCGWSSSRGPETDPIWAEYYRLSEICRKASSDLWMATDVEYGDDPIANAAWEWRYWKVMSRKCCHYQLTTRLTDWAGETMSKLHNAEANLMKACGLSEMYKSPCHYIEEAFPNLKCKENNE